MSPKSKKIGLDCGIGPGTHPLTNMSRIGWKNSSNRDPILKPKLALGGGDSPYFHLWADKIAQEALEGAQGDAKGTKNHNLGKKLVPKIVKNVTKLAPKSQNGAAT